MPSRNFRDFRDFRDFLYSQVVREFAESLRTERANANAKERAEREEMSNIQKLYFAEFKVDIPSLDNESFTLVWAAGSTIRDSVNKLKIAIKKNENKLVDIINKMKDIFPGSLALRNQLSNIFYDLGYNRLETLEDANKFCGPFSIWCSEFELDMDLPTRYNDFRLMLNGVEPDTNDPLSNEFDGGFQDVDVDVDVDEEPAEFDGGFEDEDDVVGGSQDEPVVEEPAEDVVGGSQDEDVEPVVEEPVFEAPTQLHWVQQDLDSQTGFVEVVLDP